MSNKVSIKKSSVAGKIPLPADLSIGELALNFADKKIYTKDATDTVIVVGSEGSDGNDGADGRTPVITGTMEPTMMVMLGPPAGTQAGDIVISNAAVPSTNAIGFAVKKGDGLRALPPLVPGGFIDQWVNIGQIAGHDGADGPAGAAGADGSDGSDGADSTVAGPTGPAGAQGPIGATGTAGADGSDGAQGLQGAKGDTGAAGSTGAASTVAGPAGSTGGVGAAGTNGTDGSKGDKGDTGAAMTVFEQASAPAAAVTGDVWIKP